MKKVFSFIVLAIFATGFAAAQDVTVINDKNAEPRKVSSFHGIRVSSAFDVIIKQGNEEAVVVSASEEKYRSRIKTEVVDGILRITYDNEGVWKWNSENKKLRAYISVKNIDKLDISGATDVKIDGVLKGTNLKVNLSGASSLKGAVAYESMNIDQSGASDSKLSGSVKNLDVDVNGASDFNCFELVADNCRAVASGASDIFVTVNNDLKVNASGASDVQYKGTASVSDFKTSGASSLKKRTK
ncbi:DUF2807 domain-containing protein [Lacibacter luteus]|uniref:DUF2807 domain-containing protein n=1 Tax=Lacibacter luteus TaxID=2508719 RepID=A0A4Q1CMK7_9BACT|nr:head GIN domain-containing protein [Lacibacter luteus]RXK62273.1 DUF2807 domain-containing protein [Lacibacter luteus]